MSTVGQINIGGYRYQVGAAYAHQDVQITFDKDTAECVVEDSQQVEIKRLKPRGLKVEEITDLHPPPRQGPS